MGNELLLAVAVFGLLGLSTSPEADAKGNFLIGRWEGEQQSPGWIGFRWIEFTDTDIRSDVFSEILIDRYDINDAWARVHTLFGETYVFEIAGVNRICLPAARIQALTDLRETAKDEDQLCYLRV